MPFWGLYLDIIHELTHVKQFMDGKKLFDWRHKYVEMPTEVEAFRNAVEGARRLGWMTKESASTSRPSGCLMKTYYYWRRLSTLNVNRLRVKTFASVERR
ncbi:MAG: hypothetical protein ACUVTL_10060 [Thermoproteota archaeon]